MLGHKLCQRLDGQFDVYATFRRPPSINPGRAIFDPARSLSNVSVEDFGSVVHASSQVRPDVVVNCIGIVKQDAAAKDPATCIEVNSLFPHRLAAHCREAGARLVHLSTDCVFSGRKGNYSEADVPDAEDLYGRTKLLGEVAMEGCLTIRTSMIGRELSGTRGLVEWFLSQNGGCVSGFERAVFSGFTTNALSGIIAEIIDRHIDLSGVWHVAAEPISKFDLLALIKHTYGLDIKIERDKSFVCDRSLDGSRFLSETGIHIPPWLDMIESMIADPTPYDKIREAQ